MMEWIVSSSALILGVLALRALLRGKISLRLQYALWLIVLVRLLCPGTLFHSGLSIQNAVSSIANQPVFHSAVPEAPYESPNELPDANIPEKPQNAPAEGLTELNPPVSVPEPVTIRRIDWTAVALWVWIAGTVAMLAFTLGCNVRFVRMIAKDRREMTVPQASVPVYVSGWVKTPCLVGLFQPVIYLTADVAEEPDTWDHVIRHEMTHLDHFDHVFSLLRCVALCIHWFNPLVWIAARASKEDCELACDEGTIARLGEGERIRYGETLIRLTCRSSHPSDLMIASTTMMGTKSAIRERVKLIAMRPRTLAAALVVCLAAIGILVGCTFTGAVDPPETTEPSAPVETTVPVETLPVDEEGYILVTDRIGVSSLKSDLDLPEELWPYLITYMEDLLSAYSSEHGRIFYVHPEEGTESLNDLGLWAYRVRYSLKKVGLYQGTEAILLFHRDENGWTYLKSFADEEIRMMVEEGEVTQEEIDTYGNETNAALAVFWLEQSGRVPYLTHINKALVETMISNGGTQVERSGRSYDCVIDGWEDGQWMDYPRQYKWKSADEDVIRQLSDVEFIKLSDDLGNYICVYDWGNPVLELCAAGEESTFWQGSIKRLYSDNEYGISLFGSYLRLYFRESICLEQFVVEAENYQEALDKIGLELIPARHLGLEPDNPYRALEVRLVEPVIDVGEVNEDELSAAGMVHYAIRQEELDIGPYGNVFEGDGELKGWLMMHIWFWVYQIEDGLWICSEGAM